MVVCQAEEVAGYLVDQVQQALTISLDLWRDRLETFLALFLISLNCLTKLCSQRSDSSYILTIWTMRAMFSSCMK